MAGSVSRHVTLDVGVVGFEPCIRCTDNLKFKKKKKEKGKEKKKKAGTIMFKMCVKIILAVNGKTVLLQKYNK